VRLLLFGNHNWADDTRKEPPWIPVDLLNPIEIDIATHLEIFGLRMSDDGHGLLRRVFLKFLGDVMNQNMRLTYGLASDDMRTQSAMLLQDVYTFLILKSVGLFINVVFFRRNENAIVVFQKQAKVF